MAQQIAKKHKFIVYCQKCGTVAPQNGENEWGPVFLWHQPCTKCGEKNYATRFLDLPIKQEQTPTT